LAGDDLHLAARERPTPLGECPRALELAAMSGDARHDPEREWVLPVIGRVQPADLPLPVRVLGRRREPAGAQFHEAQVPEGRGGCDLVPLAQLRRRGS
jgi:hypothetical protein